MTMLKLKNFMVVFLLACVLLMPAGAFAAQGDIFSIISAKMISTVQDVRRIVYIIAGFGLIMFAVLAVFNKISFKHLAYIMIGLSLLSVMMPFINYFSGAQLTDKDFNYGNFIAGGDASIVGSDASSKTPCTGALCPSEGDAEGRGILDGATVTADGRKMPDIMDPGLAGGLKAPDTGLAGGLKTGLDLPGAEEKPKKSAKQILKDIAAGAKSAIAAGQNVASAVEHGKKVIDQTVNAAGNINDIINGDKNFLDKIGSLAQVTGSAIDNVSSSTKVSLGHIQGAVNSSAKVGDIAKGNTNTSDSLAGFNKDMNSAKGAVGDAASNAKDYTNTARDLYDSTQRLEDLGNRVNGWFDKK